MTGRRFPPPWTVVEHRESFWVQDASGQTVDGSISATTKKPARQAKAGQGAHRDEAADGCTRCSTSVAPTVPAGSSEFGCRIREPAHEPRAIPHLDLVALPQFQGLGDRILIARDLDIDRAQEVAIPADEIDPVIRHGSAPNLSSAHAQNGVGGSLCVSLDQPLVGKRSLTGFGDRHPDNGNPPRAGAYRPRLDRSQPIARKPVQQRVRETMGQHVRHGPAMRRIGK
jgi:hypothetical protein